MSVTRFENKTKVADITPNIDDILNAIYPIGVIVCGAKPTVGTWEKVVGRFLLGSSSSHKAGSTGGEETHKLTVNEIPSHTHNFVAGYAVWGPRNTNNAFATGSGNNWAGSDALGGNYARTVNTGGNQAHNNMPPYLSVDMWRRTA